MELKEAVEVWKSYNSDTQARLDHETIPGYVVEAFYMDGELSLTTYTTDEFIAEMKKANDGGEEE